MATKSVCENHGTHEFRIKQNEEKHDAAKQERIRLRVKDKELEQTINRWKWIGVGFATCFTAVSSLTVAIIGAVWWMLGNQQVINAVIKAKGGQA